jgi:hypothetical protein
LLNSLTIFLPLSSLFGGEKKPIPQDGNIFVYSSRIFIDPLGPLTQSQYTPSQTKEGNQKVAVDHSALPIFTNSGSMPSHD